MLISEIARRIKNLEIRTNQAVDELLGGAYHSVFKGRGIEFDEVREYTMDDDAKDIDWNVSARSGMPYVKKYIEERELNVLLMVDVSSSTDFGSKVRSKMEAEIELAALVAFCAIKNQDKVGLMMFSDKIELFLPPRSGKKHTLRLIRELFSFEHTHCLTNLEHALIQADKLLNKRTVIFVISDFIDSHNYEKALKMLNRKHDVIALHLQDPLENHWSELLPCAVEDAESGEKFVFGGRKYSDSYELSADAINYEQKKICDRNQVDLIEINTQMDVMGPLIKFFQKRRLRRRK